MKKLIVVVMIMAMVMTCGFIMTSCNSSDTIKIGCKFYVESEVSAHLVGIYIEEKLGLDYEVVRFGSTSLANSALESGEIDMYVEYTGTAYMETYAQEEMLSKQATFDWVKARAAQDDIVWFEPLGWENTYVLSVTQATATQYNLVDTSDIEDLASGWTLGCDTEFAVRSDGLDALEAAYGFEFDNVSSMSQDLTYDALKNGDIDINVSYSTDARIFAYNLVNLNDDLAFFPPYQPCTIVNQSILDKYPELSNTLKGLEGQYPDSVEISSYNNMCASEGEEARTVARTMLEDKELIS